MDKKISSIDKINKVAMDVLFEKLYLLYPDIELKRDDQEIMKDEVEILKDKVDQLKIEKKIKENEINKMNIKKISES